MLKVLVILLLIISALTLFFPGVLFDVLGVNDLVEMITLMVVVLLGFPVLALVLLYVNSLLGKREGSKPKWALALVALLGVGLFYLIGRSVIGMF